MYNYALHNKWDKAKSIYDKYPDMVRIPLSAGGDTALHIAVIMKNTTFVKELVKLMTLQDLEIKNADGNTAFCMAAITGNDDLFKFVMEKYQDMPVSRGQDEMLPVHLAVLTGFHKIVDYLSDQDLLKKMRLKDIEQLFFMTINSSMYGKSLQHDRFSNFETDVLVYIYIL